MKIRTRLLLFLLPPMISCIIIISSVLSFNWYKEIIEGFKTRLKATVVSCGAMITAEEISQIQNGEKVPHSIQKNINLLFDSLSDIKEELDITSLYIVSFEENKNRNFLFTDLSQALKKITYVKNENVLENWGLKKNDIRTSLKDVFITPVYKSKSTSERIMTGYAPITDDRTDTVIALMAADVSVSLIEKKMQKVIFIIIVSSLLTIALMTTTLFIVANKISKPVQKLSNSALSIAAGQYGNYIKVKGPKEIVELSNTLNTMSECLHDNINHLKENSILREKMYGKYESALLLQKHMLQKVVDECYSDFIAVKAISFFSTDPKGVLCNFLASDEGLKIHLVEAKEKGFEGMYELLTNYQHFIQGKRLNSPHMEMILDIKDKALKYKSNKFTQPLFWSLNDQHFIEGCKARKLQLEKGDFFFLYNLGLTQFFADISQFENILNRTLKVFADDGLETCSKMIKKEIAFAIKKKELEDDIHLLSFQLLH